MSLAYSASRVLLAPRKAVAKLSQGKPVHLHERRFDENGNLLKFLASRKWLARLGVEAMLPRPRPKYRDGEQDVTKLSVKERVWHQPKISNRKINILRKIARQEGTYGKFDPVSLKGWEPQWDIDLAIAKIKGTGRMMMMRKPRLTGRARTREARSQKIDEHMIGMDERMQEVQAARMAGRKKPSGIVEKYNKLMKASRAKK